VTNALAKLFPDDPPLFGAHAARLPRHGPDPPRIGGGRLRAGGDCDEAERGRAASPRRPAVAYCQGTILRAEIEARPAGKLEFATDYTASAIADRHGHGEVSAKIQAHVILAG
jgi:hypothetical protein